MSCRVILERLSQEFDNWSCAKHLSCKSYELNRRDRALAKRRVFLSRYPFVSRPGTIRELRPDSVYNPGAGNDYFFKWIAWSLKALGNPGLRGPDPIVDASRKVHYLRELLHVVADANTTIAEKIDANWDRISGFGGGDRVLAKKIVETYFPDKVMPIFRHKDMEHFVTDLGLNAERNRLSNGRYHSMSRGEQFELISKVLLEAKKHLPVLQKEDSYYFMYVLYAGSLRPPWMVRDWRGHSSDVSASPARSTVSRESHVGPTVPDSELTDDQFELATGIKKGQPYHNSKAARKAIELRAMELAKKYYADQEWSVEDTSRNHPYDLRCTRPGEELRVEVKGKTDDGSKVLITRNEVANARDFPRVALFIVSHIKVIESNGRPVASGGQPRECNPWDISRGILDPVQYEYTPLA